MFLLIVWVGRAEEDGGENMTKEQMEMKKAISAGVTEGIVTAVKKIDLQKPERSILEQARAIKKYCKDRRTCRGCKFVYEDERVQCSLEGIPDKWGLNDIE